MVFKTSLNNKTISKDNEDPPDIAFIENASIQYVPKPLSFQYTKFFLLLIIPLLALKILLYSTGQCYNGEVGYINLNSISDQLKQFRRNVLMDVFETHFGSFLPNYYFSKRETFKKTYIPEVDLPNPPVPATEKCSIIKDNDKFDCLPRGEVNEKNCVARGCCFFQSALPNVPYCFYPQDYTSYKYTMINKTDRGYSAVLTQQFKSPYPKDIPKLSFTATFMTEEILLILITDDKNSRYRLPFPEIPSPSLHPLENPLYNFILNPNSTGFKVVRAATNCTIFDTENVGGFIFSDQLIQMTAKIPSNNIFGIGESRHPFRVGADWQTIAIHNHDRDPVDNVNGYGAQPVYLGFEPEGGNSHIVFVLSSYSMDIALQPSPAITYRLIGGPLIIGFALGPTPLDAHSQYSHIIGKPFLPPYWALGFHLCRFGYNSLDEMKKVWNNTRMAGIPFDTQWTDLDYMKDQNDFTLSEKFKDLPKFVKQLHDVGMQYIILIDPGISGSEPKGTYPPLDMGLEKDIFVKDPSGKAPLYGKVWNPKSTVFPDFTHPQAVPYWVQLIEDFHKVVEFDGAWIDMNEPSNMVDGSLTGCPSNKFENPPYVPAVEGGKLNYKTICMSSKHHDVQHYMVHNIYASLEAVITNFAMMNARDGRRALVISRANSPGLGTYAGHWTGDVHSTWDDMAQSIPDMLSFSLFGIPMVGADICGFNDNTTVALCSRWTQLGAFYPFSRNHNGKSEMAQDPVSLGIADIAKGALTQRYALLPYLYTLFWEAHSSGTPVVRPTFYLCPDDQDAYQVEDQFLWGDGLLIAPVLKEGITFVTPYLPKGAWYFLGTEGIVRIDSKGQKVSVPAPLKGPVPLFVRGGAIIPCQEPAVTTAESRKKPYYLLVGLSSSGTAEGSLFIDDGDFYDGSYNLLLFQANVNSLKSNVQNWSYHRKLILANISIFGNFTSVKSVIMNGSPVKFSLSSPELLQINDINWGLQEEFNITWT